MILRRRPVVGIEHDRLVEDRFELAPFGVLTGELQSERARLKIPEDDDLRFELGQRLRGRRLIDDLLLGFLGFLARRLVEIVRIIGRESRRMAQRRGAGLPA